VPLHERAEGAVAAVGGQHRDKRQPGRWHRGEPWQGQLERERVSGADGLVVVEDCQGVVVFDVRGQVGVLARAVGGGHGAAEALPLPRVDWPDLNSPCPFSVYATDSLGYVQNHF
jgi:hypothetical protein